MLICESRCYISINTTWSRGRQSHDQDPDEPDHSRGGVLGAQSCGAVRRSYLCAEHRADTQRRRRRRNRRHRHSRESQQGARHQARRHAVRRRHRRRRHRQAARPQRCRIARTRLGRAGRPRHRRRHQRVGARTSSERLSVQRPPDRRPDRPRRHRSGNARHFHLRIAGARAIGTDRAARADEARERRPDLRRARRHHRRADADAARRPEPPRRESRRHLLRPGFRERLRRLRAGVAEVRRRYARRAGLCLVQQARPVAGRSRYVLGLFALHRRRRHGALRPCRRATGGDRRRAQESRPQRRAAMAADRQHRVRLRHLLFRAELRSRPLLAVVHAHRGPDQRNATRPTTSCCRARRAARC